jgi:hypothetical protein
MLARYGGAFATSAALHIAVALWLAGPPTPRLPLPHGRNVEVILLPPSEDRVFHGLKPVERSDPGWHVGDFSEEGRLAGGDLDRIAKHVAVLFPFVTPGLDLDAFFPGTASAPSSRLLFENPFIRKKITQPAPRGPRLLLTPANLQAIVDKSWTRSRRWDAFATIRDFCLAFDADDSRLAALVASYRDQNALQPYADGKLRDLRVWAQLGLAADHASFIGFVRDYAVAHPGTKATTELLLLVDTIAQANEDALAVLVETDEPDDLAWTRQTHPHAYALARQIQAQYAKALTRRRLNSRAAIEEYYERGRLALLARILATTPNGYRANDVRFLIGSILWKESKRADAMRAWHDLGSTNGDSYAIAIGQLRVALESTPPDPRNIEYILKNQQGRWLAFSDERLRRFGYRVDTF